MLQKLNSFLNYKGYSNFRVIEQEGDCVIFLVTDNKKFNEIKQGKVPTNEKVYLKIFKDECLMENPSTKLDDILKQYCSVIGQYKNGVLYLSNKYYKGYTCFKQEEIEKYSNQTLENNL